MPGAGDFVTNLATADRSYQEIKETGNAACGDQSYRKGNLRNLEESEGRRIHRRDASSQPEKTIRTLTSLPHSLSPSNKIATCPWRRSLLPMVSQKKKEF
jgi:hypothetical protein